MIPVLDEKVIDVTTKPFSDIFFSTENRLFFCLSTLISCTKVKVQFFHWYYTVDFETIQAKISVKEANAVESHISGIFRYCGISTILQAHFIPYKEVKCKTIFQLIKSFDWLKIKSVAKIPSNFLIVCKIYYAVIKY